MSRNPGKFRKGIAKTARVIKVTHTHTQIFRSSADVLSEGKVT